MRVPVTGGLQRRVSHRCPASLSAGPLALLAFDGVINAQLLDTALEFIKYDPNYDYDGDSDDGAMVCTSECSAALEPPQNTDGDDQDEEDGGEYSDDDDQSWKVTWLCCTTCGFTSAGAPRRRQVSVLSGCQSPAAVRPALCCRIAGTHFSAERFMWWARRSLASHLSLTEREENVLVDVMQAYTALLNQFNFLFVVSGQESTQQLKFGLTTYLTCLRLNSMLLARRPW